LKNRIGKEGWGKQFLSKQLDNGHWGRSFYQPKWISTHYTLLDLRHLELPPGNPQVDRAINLALEQEKGADGGIKVHADSSHITQSDVCVNGMFLNYACHFKAPEKPLESVVDFILSQRMKDGGFNCRRNRSGARHSSLHSTLSVAEGIRSYYRNGYEYRLPELLEAEKSSQEFMLLHQLYISDRTGKIIKKDFLRLTFPGPVEVRYPPGPGLFSVGRGGVRSSDGTGLPGFIEKKAQRWSLERPGQIFRAGTF
jgi:hypothetical protein